MELIILAGLTIAVAGLSLWLLWCSSTRGEQDSYDGRLEQEETRCSLCMSANQPLQIEQQIHQLRPSEIAVQHDLMLSLGSANPSTSGTAQKPSP